MSIVTLKTNLRSLKYSFLGGIGEPLVTKDIPNGRQVGDKELEVDTNAIKNSLNRIDRQAQARKTDLQRFKILLNTFGKSNSAPQSTKFISNLALINQQATLDKIQKRDFEGLGRQALGGLADTGKIVASTLAQVPVAGTGIHFVYGGAVGNEYLPGGGGTLGSFLRSVVGGSGVQGHELVIAGKNVINPVPYDRDNSSAIAVDDLPGSIKSTDEELTNSIKSADEKPDPKSKIKSLLSKENIESSFKTGEIPRGNSTTITTGSVGQVNVTYSQNETYGSKLVSDRVTDPGNRGQAGSSTEPSPLKTSLHADVSSKPQSVAKSKDTFGTFNPDFGKGFRREDERAKKAIWITTTGDQSKYSTSDPNTGLSAVDIYNQQDIFDTLPEDVKEDIIPFEFQIFDPSRGGEPRYLFFRAFLDNFDDNFIGNWSPTEYIGRAEELYNYRGFKREITFTFKLAAFTKEELIPIYKKLNYLAGSTAPSYSSDQSFMRGVFTKITIGDYLQKVPGFFTGIGLSWNTIYPWEIGYDDTIETNTNKNGDELPRNPTVLEVTVNYQPVHNFNPSIGNSFIGTTRQVVNA